MWPHSTPRGRSPLLVVPPGGRNPGEEERRLVPEPRPPPETQPRRSMELSSRSSGSRSGTKLDRVDLSSNPSLNRVDLSTASESSRGDRSPSSVSGNQSTTKRPGGVELPVSIDNTPLSPPLDRVDLSERVGRGHAQVGGRRPPAEGHDRVTAHESGLLSPTSALDLLNGDDGNFGRVDLPSVKARVSGSLSESGRVELPMTNQLMRLSDEFPTNQSVQARVSGSSTADGGVELPPADKATIFGEVELPNGLPEAGSTVAGEPQPGRNGDNGVDLSPEPFLGLERAWSNLSVWECPYCHQRVG